MVRECLYVPDSIILPPVLAANRGIGLEMRHLCGRELMKVPAVAGLQHMKDEMNARYSNIFGLVLQRPRLLSEYSNLQSELDIANLFVLALGKDS